MQLLQQRAKELARDAPRGHSIRESRALTTRLRESLPFQLTGAQVRSIREIVADMVSDRRMQRLLQGDVGSGKTIVALFAALLAIENGYQAAIMVPTELLAEQHVRSIGRLLAAAWHRAGAAHRKSSGARATRRRRATGVAGSGAGDRHACARAGRDGVREARLRRDRRAASVRRRAAEGAQREGRDRRTCCSCRPRRFRDRSRSRSTAISI